MLSACSRSRVARPRAAERAASPALSTSKDAMFSSAARSSREKSGGKTALTTTRPIGRPSSVRAAASSMVSVVGISSGSVTSTMAEVVPS